ncbi:LPS assembly lipoprotein LptE [Mesorhizobium sp. KR1-2]|uniref:LPS assembly lipoprotein LptE n=1 Tax=Mesorhizobium sp. KR1-2 TaxID=3156609 RepID=UPI0032B60EF0
MSLPDQTRSIRTFLPRGLAVLGAVTAMAAISACTVRPLYSDAPVVSGVAAGTVAPGLNTVAIKPVQTRYAQQVRNHLIFGLNGGAGQPPTPLYGLTLDVTERKTASAVVQRATEDEPTAATMTLTSNYTLVEIASGKVVGAGKRSIAASFDVPRQSFAALRAERNAEDRAARELAELLRLAIAQDLLRP